MQSDRNHRLAFMNSKKTTTKGFTLVEMAIVLVVIGLLVGMGAGMIGPLTTMSKVRESREIVESDITSITGWAASNNRLPDATTNTATYFTNTLKSVNDTWGNPVYYLYSCPFGEDAVVSAYCTDASSFSKDTICGRKTTSLRIITPTATIQNVAFVLMSDMYDSVQTTLDGNLTTLIGGTITTTAVPNTVITRSGAVSPRVGTLATITLDANNSDIVRWVTLDELRTKIGCQGAQLKIVNNELPATSLGSTYSANIFADGGVPYVYTPPSPAPPQNRYCWCVEINSRQAAQGLPNGFTFSTNFIRYPDDTSTPTRCIDQIESAGWLPWTTNLVIAKSASSTDTGSFSMTVYARDNQEAGNSLACNSATPGDNCTQKTFVLTVSP